MSSFHTRCNGASCPPWGASAKCVHQVVYLRQPVVFLSTREEWNFSLWSSSKVELLHPEWGMITVLVRVVKASRMIVIFTASHDDRFHSTPTATPAANTGMKKTNRHANLELRQLSCAVRVNRQRHQQRGLFNSSVCVDSSMTRTHAETDSHIEPLWKHKGSSSSRHHTFTLHLI